MNPAVYLNAETKAVAIEIDDKSIDNLLTPEFKAVHPSSPHHFPEFTFDGGHGFAQPARELDFIRRNLPVFDDSLPGH